MAGMGMAGEKAGVETSTALLSLLCNLRVSSHSSARRQHQRVRAASCRAPRGGIAAYAVLPLLRSRSVVAWRKTSRDASAPYPYENIKRHAASTACVSLRARNMRAPVASARQRLLIISLAGADGGRRHQLSLSLLNRSASAALAGKYMSLYRAA